MSANRSRNIAQRRLKRDLIELQRANIVSIAAQPLDDDIFEWHVNIKPTDGVYSGVYFHLIVLFPQTYPSDPPRVKICTQIKHPNIFGEWLCIDMLRAHGETTGPYAAWSNSYSATSILMQLQSFLFAGKVQQYGGYQINARLSNQDVTQSLSICKSFQCQRCSHSHNTPWPKVEGPPEALIKVFPTDPKAGHVEVQGSACQTTHTRWVGAYGEFGCNYVKVFYEAFINWTGGQWSKTNISGGLCRFGFGTEYASVCGVSQESFGYGGTGMYSWANQFNKFGESFTKNDTITVAVDFDKQRIYFAKNGRLMEPNRELYIPNYLQGKVLFPILSFKNSRAEFNFSSPKKPCKWLMKNGFKSLEQVALEQGTMDGEQDNDYKEIEDNTHNVDWHHYGIIDELWVSIFESLEIDEIFRSKFVCKKWYKLLGQYNILERNEICCYFTKAKLGQSKGGEVLGIGLTLKPQQNGYVHDIHSQMDILSLNAWKNGCKRGVWGEILTHFLPLVMNRKHAEIADTAIYQYLKEIKSTLGGHSNSNQSENLQLIDTLITMMNRIVVQFVMGNENVDPNKVSMGMCEKVVLGYCALHHLLLYLVSKDKSRITDFANRKVSKFINKAGGCNKSMCKDLGKFLIYLMISDQYSWSDVASTFIKEVFTRNVKWMMKDSRYNKYNTTQVVYGRSWDTFNASKISRRLVMFQVWFMRNNANETLQGYNQRLGRPRPQIKHEIVGKTKYILGSKSWWNYFDELGVIMKDDNAIDQLLRFAIYNSSKNGYHTSYNSEGPVQRIDPPRMDINNPQNKGIKEFVAEGNRGRGKQNNVRGSGWRGRGRGGKTRYQNAGRGRGMPNTLNINNNHQPGAHPGAHPGHVNNNNNQIMNQNQAPPQMPRHQLAQNGMNRNIINNVLIQRQQPVIPLIPNPNQNQYRAPARYAPAAPQQAAIPQVQNVNVMNNNIPFTHVNNGINMNANMIQRPAQVQNIVNGNFGWNQAPTAHFQQQRVIPIAPNGNMNNVNLNTHLIQRPMAQIPTVPLCAYYRSAVGCALGQSCMYRH